ncbi:MULTISPECIES: type II toxin-antitoxin system RelE/ParE family toxin [Stenotrophomonas]|uniref:type II toxin-antitoxin system RelE/ParE family toxin n=1 Tax=Stenotrophomonas TaxID=40323 RepID=UPI0008720DA7|nr:MULTISPECIES: type II toxin-antitoxin system RelE/ParE family toxin [Stenotrophomonas]OEZ00377.1 plasmid stabilization protein [Stenotrophomonas sp. BIIR7]
MNYRVQFTPAALDQLDALEEFIEAAGLPIATSRYSEAIVAYCETFALFPLRGVKRDDILPGVRMTHFKSRTVISLRVDEDNHVVSILGVFYGGQDYEAVLREPASD